MLNQMGGLRRKFLESQLITTEKRTSEIEMEKIDHAIEWITFF